MPPLLLLSASLPIRAFVLLLAFGLGGLVAPVAHAWSHLGETSGPAHTEEAGEKPSLELADSHADRHDCSLCEVRFAATNEGRQTTGLAGRLVDADVAAPAAPDIPAPRSVFGRAPPALG